MVCTSTLVPLTAFGSTHKKQPNIVFVFADQWRAQAMGYVGNKSVLTPNLDKLASESLRFTNALSCMPVSTPYRASLITGQYALSHGLFLNDVKLNPEAKTIGKSFKAAGYNTGYVGKWHINGKYRSAYIQPEDRQGFDYFKGLECTHNYNHSAYYDNNDTTKRYWKGYDAFPETESVMKYIKQKAKEDKPFMVVLSFGAPHNPYDTAPQKYKDMYKDITIKLRPNVPKEDWAKAIKEIKGYYAHISALDDCVGQLQTYIRSLNIEEETIFIFTADHGDMLYSHNKRCKQKPYDESIRIPFLMKYPAKFGKKGKDVDVLFNVVDVMPTLLSICDIPIPETVEGTNLLPILMDQKKDMIEGALIECISPFGEYDRRKGGRAYRGVRTKRYTYVRDLNGPWLLFDNEKDPYQMNNRINKKENASLQKKLEVLLQKMLADQKDSFLPGSSYIKKWGYKVDENGTVKYIN